MGTKVVERLRILVTDAHSRAALGAIRSLGRLGHSVVAGYAEGTERPAVTWSRYCSGEIRYPAPDRQQAAFRDWICDQGRRGWIDVILPVAETSVVAVAAVRAELAGQALAIVPSDLALRYTLSKFHATRLALDIGVPSPDTVFVSDGNELKYCHERLSTLGYPVVLKSDNYVTASGGYAPGRTVVARDADQVQTALEELEQLRTPVIAQQFVMGEGVGAFLLHFDGRTRLWFAHRRLHEVPYTGGASSLRESCHDEELVRLSEKLLDAIDYDGVAMVEFRRSARDQRPYFLEINGRLWGSLALALHCGVDFPAALIRCYREGASTVTAGRPYRGGVRCRNIYPGEVNHLLSILTAVPRTSEPAPPRKLPAILRFIALTCDPSVRHDYFWWSDPLPGVRQLSSMVRWFGRTVVKWVRDTIARRHEDGMLNKLRQRHEARRAMPAYFEKPLSRILFLCYGNICRSAFAAEYWNTRLQPQISAAPVAISAGFHPVSGRQSPKWLVEVAAEYDVKLDGHRSAVVSAAHVQAVDAVFVMDRYNYRRLTEEFPWAIDKAYLLGMFADDGRCEIVDPYGRGKANARVRCEQLISALEGLMKQALRG
jgi:protein-tyrosine-phosphatase/predicted ATP-grasp superfamily ATP-dependent carboligase